MRGAASATGHVRLLVAARSAHEVIAAERRYRLGRGDAVMLTTETHAAFPDLPLFIDPSWPANRGADTIEVLLQTRLRQATETAGQRRNRIRYEAGRS